jgi:alkyl hydroperoxide reductase subunit AhpF
MLAMGRKWLGEIYRNTEVINQVSAIEIIGQSQAQGVSCTLSSGDKIDIDANHIFLHQGVVPNVNLTMATGLAHQWDHQAHCWRPVIDVTGKSSDEQIYIAGDGWRYWRCQGGRNCWAIGGKRDCRPLWQAAFSGTAIL